MIVTIFVRIRRGVSDPTHPAEGRARIVVTNIAFPRPWTVERFLTWAARQEGRYEFDGIQPVAMTGGSADHSRITLNIHGALRARLRGTPCSSFGPDLAVRTIGEKVRCPDALITCTKFPGTQKMAPDVVVVFEVLSPESGQRERIEKLREYSAVTSIRRYVIVESRTKGLLVLHRAQGDDPFTAQGLTADDILPIPEVRIEVPMSEIYEDVDIPSSDDDGT